jgi:hypothetical protein
LDRPILPISFANFGVQDGVTPLSVKETAVIDRIFSANNPVVRPRNVQEFLRKYRAWFIAAAHSINVKEYQRYFIAHWQRPIELLADWKILVSRRVPASYIILAFLIGLFVWLPSAFHERSILKPLEIISPGQPLIERSSEESLAALRFQSEPSRAASVAADAIGSAALKKNAPAILGRSQHTTSDALEKNASDSQHTRLAKPHQNAPSSARRRSVVLKTVQTVGLRNEPRYGAAKGQPLAPGARLVMLEASGNWLRVRSEATGEIGYVRREFLSTAPGA